MKKYIIKVKLEDKNQWTKINEKGMLIPKSDTWDNTPTMKFLSKDDAVMYVKDSCKLAQKYATCISSAKDDSSRRVLYGYIMQIVKHNSILMALVNSKLTSDHTELTTTKDYCVPGVGIRITICL